MKRIHFEVGETAVSVISDDSFHQIAKDAIYEAREIILSKIGDDPFFKTTFDPYPVNGNDAPLIQRMCNASVLAGVGPMAGVAGAIALYAVEKMSEAGASFAVVENGGDIALKIDRDITVGLYSGYDKLKDLALSVSKRDGVFGICSSSGKVGPSVSFGDSNVCTVFSDDVILADACATALGNLIKNGSQKELSEALEKIGDIDGVDGCIACSNGLVAVYGDVPEFTKAKIDEDSISKIVYQN